MQTTKMCRNYCILRKAIILYFVKYIMIAAVVLLQYYVYKNLGPVVQSIVSLTSALVVKMLRDLVSAISKVQVFLLNNVSSFCKC